MEKITEIQNAKKILSARVGSVRYGYASKDSDLDVFYLTKETDIAYHDRENNTTYFAWSAQHMKDKLGHPILLGNLTAECTGNQRLLEFLQKHKFELIYAEPEQSVLFGLEYIAAKESIGIDTATKPAIITAFILSHMAARTEDPFLLTEDEKMILLRAHSGEVGVAERTDIYRYTLCPDGIGKLRRMRGNLIIKKELFKLVDDIILKEEFL